MDALEEQKKQFRQLKEQEEDFMKEYCRHKRELNELEDYSQRYLILFCKTPVPQIRQILRPFCNIPFNFFHFWNLWNCI